MLADMTDEKTHTKQSNQNNGASVRPVLPPPPLSLYSFRTILCGIDSKPGSPLCTIITVPTPDLPSAEESCVPSELHSHNWDRTKSVQQTFLTANPSPPLSGGVGPVSRPHTAINHRGTPMICHPSFGHSEQNNRHVLIIIIHIFAYRLFGFLKKYGICRLGRPQQNFFSYAAVNNRHILMEVKSKHRGSSKKILCPSRVFKRIRDLSVLGAFNEISEVG